MKKYTLIFIGAFILCISLFIVGNAEAGITYDAPNNKIIVTGYSEALPCNFNNLYNADKAGILTLFTGTPAINIVLATQIKPSDEIALKIDFVLVNSGAGAGDTIDIVGTDKNGNAQLETLTTTADGTFTTTKWFKTITDIDCNGFNSGTLTVRQNQWGIIKKNNDVFTVLYDCIIYLGDINTHTYFGDKNKVIYFPTPYGNFIDCEPGKAHIYFGEKVSDEEKTGTKGCIIKSDNAYSYVINKPYEIYFYGTTFISDNPWSSTPEIGFNSDTRGEVWNCRVQNIGLAGASDNVSVENLVIVGDLTKYPIAFNSFSTQGEMKNIQVFNQAVLVMISTSNSFTIKDLLARNITRHIASLSRCTSESYMIDWDISWNPSDYVDGLFRMANSPTAKIYRQYTFNLKVTDKDGSLINNATVILKDKDNNIADQKGFSTTTNADGVITEHTISYGYYTQVNGNTLQSYSPHTLIVNKSGYDNYTITFDLDEKIDWTISMFICSINEDDWLFIAGFEFEPLTLFIILALSIFIFGAGKKDSIIGGLCCFASMFMFIVLTATTIGEDELLSTAYILIVFIAGSIGTYKFWLLYGHDSEEE